MTESGRRYRFLVDNSPDLIWTVDKEGVFTYLSETVRSLVGWAPEELIGHHFAEIVAPNPCPTCWSTGNEWWTSRSSRSNTA